MHGRVGTERCARMGVSRRMPPSTTSVARSIRAAFTVGRRSHGPKSPQFYGFHGNPPLRAALSCATQRARMRAAKRCARGKQSGVRTGGCVHDCGCTSGCARGAYGVCDGAVSAHTTRTPPSPPHPHRSRPLPSLYFPTGCSCLPPPSPAKPPSRSSPSRWGLRVSRGGGGMGGDTEPQAQSGSAARLPPGCHAAADRHPGGFCPGSPLPKICNALCWRRGE